MYLARELRHPGLKALGTVLIAVALLLAATPGGAAQDDPGSAGTTVRATDPDVTMAYEAPSGLTVCYADVQSTGHFGQGDAAILTFQSSCSGRSRSTDIRLNAWGNQKAGETLKTAADQGMNLIALDPEPRFYYLDKDGSHSLTADDAVYLRMNNAESQTRVAATDVRITANGDHPAGSQVQNGDHDASASLSILGKASERIRHVDILDIDDFEVRDFLYLTADTSRGQAGPGDVRIYSSDTGLAFGSSVEEGDNDAKVTRTYQAIERPICYVSAGAPGTYTAGDALYLSLGTLCTGTIIAGDVRMSDNAAGPAGSRVAEGDADEGSAQTALPTARLRYVDSDNDAKFGKADIAVVDLVSRSTDTIDAGDLILTPTSRGAGTVIRDNDPLIDTPLREIGLFQDRVAFMMKGSGTAIKEDDRPYLKTQDKDNDRLEPNDLRLAPYGDHPFGGPVGIETGEIPSRLTHGTPSVCSTSSIPGEYITGDPIYLKSDGTCPSVVQAGLVRLVPILGHDSLTTVRTGDADGGMSLLPVSGATELKYTNAFGHSGWSHASALYLKVISTQPDQVEIGDIRLTPMGTLAAGEAVKGQDNDKNLVLTSLVALDGGVGYIDVDGDGKFGTADHAYATPTREQEYVSVLSVRLTALPAAFEAPEVQDAPKPTGPDQKEKEPDGQDPTGAPEQSLSESPTDTDPADTPAPGIALVIVGIGALAAAARRKR